MTPRDEDLPTVTAATPVRPQRRPKSLGALAIWIAAGSGVLVGTAGIASGANDQWASAPRHSSVPSSPPDDPSAYRGSQVEFRMFGDESGTYSDDRRIPWLEFHGGGGLVNATRTGDGPFYGRHEVFDGRREMWWFTRMVGTMPAAPSLPDDPLGPPGELKAFDAPQEAVLDVMVRPTVPPGSRFSDSCGAPEVVVLLDEKDERVLAAWRFDRSEGRIREVRAEDVSCP